MQLSVVIVNYNVKYFLHLCLHSVRKAMQQLETEVFVVDNNSTDGSVEMLQEEFPWVKVIANKHNAGFGVANNQAIAMAKGKYILLQNPDTIVAEDTYTRIVDFMELTPDAGGLGVKMIDGSGKFLPESKRGLPTPEVAFYKIFGLSVLFPKSRLFGKYHLGFLDLNEVHAVDVLSGAFMLMRKEVIDKTGAFDEQFFMYGEDIDLSYRITEAGYKNYYYPGTSIVHYKGESTKKGSLNYVFVFYKAMIIFARKHFASQKAALFSLLINTAIYIRAAIAVISRFMQLLARPALDILLMMLVMYMLIPWYEDVKFDGSGHFPDALWLVNMPLYIALWMLGLFFTNNYSKSFPRITSILYGMVLGTLSISVVYAFLSEDLRASRAIILMGASLNFLFLFLARWLWQMIRYRKIRWYNQSAQALLVIGDGADAVQLQSLLQRNVEHFRIIGFAGTRQEEELNPSFLGHYSRLLRILKLYTTDELIFTCDKVSWKEMIATMEQYRKRYTYKIFDATTNFTLGSNSKNAAGEVFTEALIYSLNTREAKYNKRFTDIVISLILLPLTPVLIGWVDHKAGLIRNIFSVLQGKKTWVGYARPDNKTLPPLKLNIICTTYSTHPDEICAANSAYAQTYSSVRDVILVLRNSKHLGS